MNFAIPDLYSFLRGPGFVISIIVFSAGFIFRTLRLFSATRKLQKNRINSESFVNHAVKPAQNRLFKEKLRNSIFSSNPVMGIISLVFHILLFIIPLFLSAHNIIADVATGVSIPAIPEKLTDFLTMVLIAAGGFFLARRVFIPRVRMISTFRDYAILLFVMAPFLSGFFAYHHYFNYHKVIFFHMIIGEIAIMILPFTSLVHMPFIFFARFNIDSEYSITTGNRSW